MIDSLRGLSILLVVLYHGDNFFTVQASGFAPLSFCLLLIAAGPVARSIGATDLEKLYGYFSCFYLIALGCATAIIQSVVAKQTIAGKLSLRISVIGLVPALYAIIAQPIPENIVWGPTLLGIGIALLLLGVTDSKHTFVTANVGANRRIEQSADWAST